MCRFQHAFRKNRSIFTAIDKFSEGYVSKIIPRIAIFMDLSDAYNSVDRNRLFIDLKAKGLASDNVLDIVAFLLRNQVPRIGDNLG